MKNDARYLQGVPDFTVLYHNVWVFLEFKKDDTSTYRPNQEYYLYLAKKWSFGFTINRDNWSEQKANLFYILRLSEGVNFYENISACDI